MRRLLVALACVGALWATPAAAQTCYGVSAVINGGGANTVVMTIGTAVASGDALHYFVYSPDDEAFTVSSVADSVNGTWSTGAANSAAGDDGGGLARSYMGHRLASGAGTPTITFTSTGGGANLSGLVFACLAAKTATFEEYATPAITASSTTHASPTGNSTCTTGVAVGVLWTNSLRTSTFDVGTKINSITDRFHPYFIDFVSSGNQTNTGTVSSAARGIGQQGIFCASGGGGGTTNLPAGSLPALGVGAELQLDVEAPRDSWLYTTPVERER